MSNNKIVYLYWNKIKIAELTFVDNVYWYRINEKNLLKVKEMGCDINYLYIKKENNNYNCSKTLPYIFEKFKFFNSREDLIQEYGILSTDNEFERLYKVACKPDLLFHNEYWISVK